MHNRVRKIVGSFNEKSAFLCIIIIKKRRERACESCTQMEQSGCPVRKSQSTLSQLLLSVIIRLTIEKLGNDDMLPWLLSWKEKWQFPRRQAEPENQD